MFLLITILQIPAVAPPSAQGQFPRACINRSSLENRECCPVPQGFTAHCITSSPNSNWPYNSVVNKSMSPPPPIT